MTASSIHMTMSRLTAALMTLLVSTLASVALAQAQTSVQAKTSPQAEGKVLYTLSNDIEVGQNAVLAFYRLPDGMLEPHPAGPFLTGGTGIDNDTNGKLGPNDNDTPLIVTADNKLLLAVNGHSNTITVFEIATDGSLAHVQGSPFKSMGIGPVSLAISGDYLLVANRNEDPHQLDELRGAAFANYASFRIEDGGQLTFVSKIELTDGQKSTQVLVSSVNDRIVFGNDFQVDVDFDGDMAQSRLFALEPAVRGQIHTFWLDDDGALKAVDRTELPETVEPAPEVPTVPLGMWDHPTRKLLYVGLVTRNQLGVFRYDDHGRLAFLSAVDNSGQDICWVRTNADGTRLYAVNNLPREDAMDGASTVTVFDISGDRAENPVEIGRVELPYPLGTFINNRVAAQPNSTAFQFGIDSDEDFLYIVAQRINQTDDNQSEKGNMIHTVRLDPAGALEVVASRDLTLDGVSSRARPQGIVIVDLDA